MGGFGRRRGKNERDVDVVLIYEVLKTQKSEAKKKALNRKL